MIKELTREEAARLRELVIARFLSRPYNGAGFNINQYKGSYQPLAEDIVRGVEGVQSSITTHRLRKFFYYTDPAVCDEGKLEKPSFGDDFVRALFQYVEEEKVEPVGRPAIPKASGSWQWRTVAMSLLLVGGMLAWQQFDQPVFWTENFDDVSPAGLRGRGFDWLDYDSAAFSRQLKPGWLTEFTYPGDYWVKSDSGEIPSIKNLLIKRLDCKRCIISTCLTNFDPNQNWQQAGLYLLGPDLDRNNIFRVVFAYDQYNGVDTLVRELRPYRLQKLQIVLLRQGKAEEEGFPLRYLALQSAFKEVGFKLYIDNRKVVVGHWAGASWSHIPKTSEVEMTLPFTPAYVGIAACQGFTDRSGRPLDADTIPAFFDYLKVEPLPTK